MVQPFQRTICQYIEQTWKCLCFLESLPETYLMDMLTKFLGIYVWRQSGKYHWWGWSPPQGQTRPVPICSAQWHPVAVKTHAIQQRKYLHRAVKAVRQGAGLCSEITPCLVNFFRKLCRHIDGMWIRLLWKLLTVETSWDGAVVWRLIFHSLLYCLHVLTTYIYYIHVSIYYIHMGKEGQGVAVGNLLGVVRPWACFYMALGLLHSPHLRQQQQWLQQGGGVKSLDNHLGALAERAAVCPGKSVALLAVLVPQTPEMPSPTPLLRWDTWSPPSLSVPQETSRLWQDHAAAVAGTATPSEDGLWGSCLGMQIIT